MGLPIIKYGDVFEIKTKIGFAYLQCIEEAMATECELIRILPGTYSDINSVNLESLVNEKEIFFIEFPLKYAIRKKSVKKIGNYTVPKSVIIPQYFRTEHIVRGELIGWHIVDRKTLRRKLVKELTNKEIKLSPSGIWNDTLIVERIEEGWTLDGWI